MLLAIELVPNLAAHFAPHHFYELSVRRGDDVLPETFGRDTFAFNGTLLPGEPLVATGRSAVHKQEADLLELKGTPALPVEIEDCDPAELTLWLNTNGILSQEQLQTYYGIRVQMGTRKLTFPLLMLKVHWEGQGLFKIYLGGAKLPGS